MNDDNQDPVPDLSAVLKDDKKKMLKILAVRFGFCGCRLRCQMEKYGENGNESKPRGRYSVCELEADQHDIPVPEKGEDGEYEAD